MKAILKQVLSLILPVTVLIIVPAIIEKHPVIATGVQFIVGGLLLLAGLFVMFQTIASFAFFGKGTLAPWSPPTHLVVEGMYRYVRNPMILGVVIVLLGEAVTLQSIAIFIWALVVFWINTLYFLLSEEPGLEKRFGEEYRAYKRNVPRWLPRLKPWDGKQ
jgi:protein-S-isoprenylcysteine O-methyltransferase Ste14